MALVNPYCTLNAVKLETGVDLGEGEEDALFEAAINQVSRWVESYCNRDWLFHDHSSTPLVVRRAHIYGNTIYLPWPIVTLTEFSIDGTIQNSEDYRGTVGDSRVYYYSLIPYYETEDWIQLKGTFGYGAGENLSAAPASNLPLALVRAVTLIAAAWSGKSKREYRDISGQIVQAYDNRIPKEAQAILDQSLKYRPLA